MNFQFYLEKLKESEHFKQFMRESPDAFLCSGFFVIDKKNGNSQQNLDYFIPEKKELVSFCVSGSCEKNPVEIIDKERIFEKISENTDFDFGKIEQMVSDEMQRQNIRKEIEKILLSLQSKDGKPGLIATIFISTLGIISAMINLENMTLENFEKKSFFDMMNIFKKS